MKKTILFSSALVALVMLASCQKEQLIETPATATGVTEFTATIGQPTKTVIDGDGKVTWTAGDEITITDAASKSAVYVATSSGESTTFTLKQDQTAVGAGPYTATYGDITKQVYDKDGANCPLTAATTDASTTNLHFSSPYAVVKVTATSSGGELVKTVVVKYGNSSSILDCDEGVDEGVKLTSSGVDFYVAVRPSTEAAALSVSFYTADKMAKKTRTENISLGAKDLLSVTFESFDWSPQKTFKAMYKETDGSLTFYYDTQSHSGEGITVYENGTDKSLFDGNKSNGAQWGYNSNRSEIKSVVIDPSVADYPFLTSTTFMFYNMTDADSILGAQNLDVSNVINMSSMFNQYGMNSPSLATYPDVSKWDTGNVTNMQYMFYRYGMNSPSLAACPKVSKWNTGKVTNMANMFNQYGQNSTHLATYPDVSKWKTDKVTNMTSMFSNYGKNSTKLTDVPDVSGWKTDNVENMGNLFANYGNANNINCKFDLTGWNLAKLTKGNIFNNFNPKTFVVTIPAKTGAKANQPKTWNGSGAYSFGPPTEPIDKYYFIPVLTGVFTVSDGKTVHFSNSNLVATIDDNGAPTAWKFAANQYDYIGNNVANTTIGNTSTNGTAGDVDLFGWSTAKTTYGISTSTSSSDYSGDFVDWGKAIGDGNTWCTLTSAEWQYLFNIRTVNGGTGEGKSYQRATINSDAKGVYGVILYPDNYISQTSATSYTSSDWTSMETAGCVFLPAAGYRKGSGVDDVGDCGYYWSSSAYDEAYFVWFGDGEDVPFFIDSEERQYGYSVRLVTDVSAE